MIPDKKKDKIASILAVITIIIICVVVVLNIEGVQELINIGKNSSLFNKESEEDYQTVEEQVTEKQATEEQTTELGENLNISDEPIYIYATNDEIEYRLEPFKSNYPEYSDLINIEYVDYEEYNSKVINELNGGSKIPSILILEDEPMEELVNAGCIKPITDIGFTLDDMGGMYQYTVDAVNYDGQIMGMAIQCDPGCYIYNMDVAQEVFGTSDPETISEYFSTWDGFFKAAEILKEHGYYIVPEIKCVERCMGNYYNESIINKINENNYSKNLEEWSEDWMDSIHQDVFGYLGADWYANYSLNTYTEGDAPKFGICSVPQGYCWGDNYACITTGCQNPGLVYLLLKYLFVDEDTIYNFCINYNYRYVNNFNVVQRIINDGYKPWNTEIIGTDNVYYYFDNTLKRIVDDETSAYLSSYEMSEETFEDTLNDDYIIPDSDSVELTYADIDDLTLKELNYAKNEIYARHGRKFKSNELQTYFNSKSWYEGTIEPDDFSDEMLSELELNNAKLLRDAEYAIDSNGYPLDQ